MASGTTLILNETTQQNLLHLILQGVTVELLQTQTWTGNVTLSGTNTFNVADGKTWRKKLVIIKWNYQSTSETR